MCSLEIKAVFSAVSALSALSALPRGGSDALARRLHQLHSVVSRPVVALLSFGA
ncbi:hypothetical protein PGTUg99_031658 [Puccinia graminis f. sp. tritici]|uniref:Uncharacterized protein n=1 Tax=Puccinia graminis f. sp. tritici TaxID=56615 RepID=A0A5B0NJ90_PUCGR|nr:hypothetical protein PGTUg99_031658 [Puccinia graminis f. sp. tritici]